MLKAATKSTRKVAKTALRTARAEARKLPTVKAAMKRIEELEHEIRRAARSSTRTYWGTYLDIEAAHIQARSTPLYADDALTPADPRFRTWKGDGYVEGQLAVQLQKGLTHSEALKGDDTRVKLVLLPGGPSKPPRPNGKPRPYNRFAVLHLRVGSEGRKPIWAEVPVKLHRAIPDNAVWKWCRLSTRLEGLREEWTVEITVDDPAPPARSLDGTLKGAIAVSWCWDLLDNGSIRVAEWASTRGENGWVDLPAKIAAGIRKPDGIRAVRDILAGSAREEGKSDFDDGEPSMRRQLARLIRESKDALPLWLLRAGQTCHLWKSLGRFHELARKWRAEKFDGAREAYDLLQAWELRDEHLWSYEAGARREALRERRARYQNIAAEWARSYKTLLYSDQNLSREAQWGEESAVRTTAAPYELAAALRNAFGDDAQKASWKEGSARRAKLIVQLDEEDDAPSWCEQCCGDWTAVGARDETMFPPRKEKTRNAWAARKAKKAVHSAESEGTRKAAGNAAE